MNFNANVLEELIEQPDNSSNGLTRLVADTETVRGSPLAAVMIHV